MKKKKAKKVAKRTQVKPRHTTAEKPVKVKYPQVRTQEEADELLRELYPQAADERGASGSS